MAYRENVDIVIDILKKVDEDMRRDMRYGYNMLEPIEILGLDRFADSAMVIRARLKTRPGKQWEVGREFNRRTKRIFDERGIEIPFPHRTLYWGLPKEGSQPSGRLPVTNPTSEIRGTPATRARRYGLWAETARRELQSRVREIKNSPPRGASCRPYPKPYRCGVAAAASCESVPQPEGITLHRDRGSPPVVPGLLCPFNYPFQLSPLFVFAQDVAFLSGRESALRSETELACIGVSCGIGSTDPQHEELIAVKRGVAVPDIDFPLALVRQFLGVRRILVTSAEGGHVFLKRAIVIVPPRRRGERKVPDRLVAARLNGFQEL